MCEKIIIQKGVTSIGRAAFIDCSNLVSVDISEGVERVGGNAFEACKKLVEVHLPEGLKTIGVSAFMACESLAYIDLPQSLSWLNYDAFMDCTSLESVIIPGGLTESWNRAFGGCQSLKSVVIEEGVTQISASAFSQCISLESVKIPKSVTYIGISAFSGCNKLISVDIPEGVTRIVRDTFNGCESLTSIKIPRSVTEIGERAFQDCNSLSDIYYSGSESEWSAISGSKYLTNAIIHYNSTGPDDINKETADGILRSGDGWTIRWACTYSHDAAGNPNNGRVEITVNDTNTVEELYLYNEASESGLPFPWELEPYNIPKSAINTLVIRGGATKKLHITADSFKDYTGLKDVVLGYVSGIDSNAFSGCTSLKSVGFLEGESGFSVIDNGAFENCTSLTEMEFPSGLTRIGAGAFQNAELGTITLGTGITDIGDDAFSGCQNLLIRCYKDSFVHQYAQKNNIPFQLIVEEEDPTLALERRKFDFSNPESVYAVWGWNWLLNNSPTPYQNSIATVALVLSAAAERSQNTIESMLAGENFGVDADLTKSVNYNNFSIDNPACTFAHKTIDNGGGIEHIIVIVGRGTVPGEGDIITDLKSSTDHFSRPASNIWNNFTNWLDGNNLTDEITSDNTKFFVMGHSLGGAVANRISYQLNQNYGSKNVYSYTFASPPTEGQSSTIVPNIFNVLCKGDYIPYFGVFADGRYGNECWFEKSCDLPFPTNFIATHSVESYMSHLQSHHDDSFRTIAKSGGTHCPVDLKIYNSSGQLVGSVTDNTIDEENMTDSVVITLTGEKNDEKNFFFLKDDTYTIDFAGTGDGVLTYTIRDTYADKTTITEKTYANVKVSNGKNMTSTVSVWDVGDASVDTSDLVATPEVQLLVEDANGKITHKILDDGMGTEVPIDDEDNPDNKPDDNTGEKPESKPSDDSGNRPENNKPNSKPGNGSGDNTNNNADNSNRAQNSRRISSGKSSEEQAVVETWKPTTPDEKKRYACMGKDAVQYTLSKDNAYRIVIENAMQGPMCFKSFEAVLSDYAIGRTYNIYTLPESVYSKDEEIQFTIKIPSDIYKKNREYKMICVTKGGLPIVYNDIDTNPETITVKTNKFYAYALIYR